MHIGLAAALALGMGVGSEAHAEAPSASGPMSSVHATFRYAGGAKQEAAVDKAIRAAIDGLPPGIYEMAYKRISETQKPAPEIVLDIEGDSIRIERAPAKTIHTTAQAPKQVVFNHGERFVWRQSVRGQTVTQRVSGVGSKTRMSYTLSADGSTLTFKVKIDADLLPIPVVYRLTYKRR